VAQNHRACRLHATTDVAAAVYQSDISFVCVGTPSLANGTQDLRHILHVCQTIGRALARKKSFHWIVARSTVLPGTTATVIVPALEEASGKKAGVDFAVCFNPEFTREGSAVADFLEPPYTILGTDNSSALAPLRELYDWVPSAIVETSVSVAEMVKYVSNAYHAVKVAFANEIGTLCKQFAVDTEAVMRVFASDQRLNISKAYLSPGFAFGGSCLPKDLRALAYRAKELDLHLPLLQAVVSSNNEHIERAVELVLNTKKKKLAILGLSFKAETDDLRESPHVVLTKKLLGEGLRIRIWDPQVSLGRLVGSNRRYIEEVIPHVGMLLSTDLQDVLEWAEVVLISTKSVTREMLCPYLHHDKIIVDVVNLEKSRRPDGLPMYQGICW
jgi:GDP-mannose 6-dehydrogenase